MVKNRPRSAKSGISMLFGALPWQHEYFECDICARIHKQGPLPAFCNNSLLNIPKFIFLLTHEGEIRPIFHRPSLKPQELELVHTPNNKRLPSK